MEKIFNQINLHSTKFKHLNSYMPLIGEFAWHSLTADTTIESVSKQHFELITDAIDRWASKKPYMILEVGAYAHATGYYLQEKYDADVTLFDLSASTLRIGNKLIGDRGRKIELVAGDFHNLPFTDEYFDIVYVFAALHHAIDYQQVVNELQRVLAPNGLLILSQEPFKREACFYKFRTNRSNKYTNFEKSLAENDLLTTIAEPSPGSRDEILFGMIENQEIPIHELIDTLTKNCIPLEVKPFYKGKIGELGLLWLKWQKESHSLDSLSIKISEDLSSRVNKIKTELDTIALGLGFNLPNKNEINELSTCIAKILFGLPRDQKSHEYHLQAAGLFGGMLKFVGKKQRGTATSERKKIIQNKYLSQYPVDLGVITTFPDNVRSVLSQSNSCIPKLDDCNEMALRLTFPESDWSFELQDNGFFALTLRSDTGKILMPIAEEVLLVLRISFTLTNGNNDPYCFRLITPFEKFSWKVFQEETILYRTIITGIDVQNNAIQVNIEALGSFPKPNSSGSIKIYFAGAFPL